MRRGGRCGSLVGRDGYGAYGVRCGLGLIPERPGPGLEALAAGGKACIRRGRKCRMAALAETWRSRGAGVAFEFADQLGDRLVSVGEGMRLGIGEDGED